MVEPDDTAGAVDDDHQRMHRLEDRGYKLVTGIGRKLPGGHAVARAGLPGIVQFFQYNRYCSGMLPVRE